MTAIENVNEIIGLKKGAIIIEPIINATSFVHIPIDATTAAKNNNE
jgi:hypothetical protein